MTPGSPDDPKTDTAVSRDRDGTITIRLTDRRTGRVGEGRGQTWDEARATAQASLEAAVLEWLEAHP